MKPLHTLDVIEHFVDDGRWEVEKIEDLIKDLSDEEITARIERGLALLQEVKAQTPTRFVRDLCDIDLDSLDLALSSTCVLGQSFGTYRTGLVEVGLVESNPCAYEDREASANHGFLLNHDCTGEDDCWGCATEDINYERLTAAWRLALTELCNS